MVLKNICSSYSPQTSSSEYIHNKVYSGTNNLNPNNNIDNSIIIEDLSHFDKYIYDKIFTDYTKKIINHNNNNFMKNIIDNAIKKNNVNLKYISDSP
jgi:hypothetical protein